MGTSVMIGSDGWPGAMSGVDGWPGAMSGVDGWGPGAIMGCGSEGLRGLSMLIFWSFPYVDCR